MAADSTEKDRDEKRAYSDTIGEFFSVGVPLHAVRAGYILRDADNQLYDAVRSGRYAHVVAPDRSGKSSLIAATAARLESQGSKVAIIDLEQIGDRDGGTDSGRWYYSVAYRLLRQLRIRYELQSWWQDKSFLSNRQRLFEFYSEVILSNISEPIVIFVDEIQCIENLPHADQLLTSFRAAHNARMTDPDFSRLSFVLLGECDPVSLMQEVELSPFNITQQVSLNDFSRKDLELFVTELNLDHDDAAIALDRIYYWTSGQPYLSQKLARAVAREPSPDNIEQLVDRIATLQLAGRAALHSEPHMSHIHRIVVNGGKLREGLLNLYGKVRKGVEVPADLGSEHQRRLMAVGLLVIDDESNLQVRNRLYEMVFTARWANENLSVDFKIPVIVVGALLLLGMIPFWYTQWLPNPYLRVLTSDEVELSVASEAYENYQSFPGHADTADNVYRGFLERRARSSDSESEIGQLASLVAELPDGSRFADEFISGYWDRQSRAAIQIEDRDAALLAKIQALVLPTPVRRQRVASLVGEDYPYLVATLPAMPDGPTVFDANGMVLTTSVGAEISQFSYSPKGVQQRETWSVTALEVSPLVRRVIVDREGSVSRIGLTLTISHARLSDLRIKVIAPSGRTVEVDPGMEQASDNDDIQITVEQLRDLLGESLSGTWSISVRDESLGVAGQLVGWNLKLNSQGVVEYFQRGLNIPDPIERETDNIWFDPSGRYAVARAMQSDSARVWDLTFAEPIRAIALPESEVLIGLDASAYRLITASQDAVNIWDTATGDKISSLAVGAASTTAVLTPDRSHLFVERRGDVDSRFELWSLDDAIAVAEVVVAGVPALVAVDATGGRVAVADFDRAVRIWDMQTTELLGQFDLPAQPSSISLSANGSTMGVVYPNVGVSLWSVANPQQPMLEEFGAGYWQLAFSPSGNIVAAGHPETGFQIFSSMDGLLIGPPLGVRRYEQSKDLLAFSQDEQVLLTGSAAGEARVWRVPVPSILSVNATQAASHTIWGFASDRPIIAAPDGAFLVIGDPSGHVHIVPPDASLTDIAEISDDVSFVGHTSEVVLLSVSPTGSMAASIAADNSLRLWETDSGKPLPYIVNIAGAKVSQMAFSANSEYVALLSAGRASIVEVSDGEIVAEYDSASIFSGMTFAGESDLYLGAEDGALQLLSHDPDKRWGMQQVWQGPEGIQLLRASPRGDTLVLVDNNNLASQFRLAEGQIGTATMQLPSDVHEIAFDLNGSRAYFRTARWLHRASSSKSGLSWLDALFVPRALRGAGIVQSNGMMGEAPRIYLPVARNGFLELLELSFGGSVISGLFGNQDQLLYDWRAKLIASPSEEL